MKAKRKPKSMIKGSNGRPRMSTDRGLPLIQSLRPCQRYRKNPTKRLGARLKGQILATPKKGSVSYTNIDLTGVKYRDGKETGFYNGLEVKRVLNNLWVAVK